MAEPLWRAPDDGGYINLTAGVGLTAGRIDKSERSMWRYRTAIPTIGEHPVSLGEGWTPLVTADWDGMPVFMKSEHLMPSGSFKDRGSVVLLNYLKQAGITHILEDSSGNAGASIATYAAAMGIDCRILIPASAPIAKRVQMAAAGAEVIPIEGSRDDVANAAIAQAESVFYAGHNLQPYFLEGTKTLAFELWEQLDFQAPDCVIVPLGQGANVMGCHLGFSELLNCGAITALPRIYAVQSENCAPYHAVFEAGGHDPIPINAKPSIADGIASATPIRLRENLAAIRESKGATVTVSENEIVNALRKLTNSGFFVEPTSATVGAAMTKLVNTGRIKQGENIVAVLTGAGLKAVEKIGAALGLMDNN